MNELCFGIQKVHVSSSTSVSNEHPPSRIADGSMNTFWTSTGLYPQELSIALDTTAIIKKVEIISMGIKSVEISKSEIANATNWERISSRCDADDADGNIQRLSPEIIIPDAKASYVRVRIMSGWSDIVSVFKISIIGTPVDVGSPAAGKNSTIAFNSSIPSGPGSLSSRLGSGGNALGGHGDDQPYNGSPKALRK